MKPVNMFDFKPDLKKGLISLLFSMHFLLMAGCVLAGDSDTGDADAMKQKTNAVRHCIKKREASGIALTAELKSEIQKARLARKEKKWGLLNDTLDRILELCGSSSPSGKNTNTEFQPDVTDKEAAAILLDADQRIEKYRKGRATLNFVDGQGRPLPNVTLKVEQTGHAFLFGANHAYQMWYAIFQDSFGSDIFSSHVSRKLSRFKLSHHAVQSCLDRFYKFANYTSIPVGWSIYEGRRGQINYALYDKALRLMHTKGISCLAHYLVWNNNTPAWVPDHCSGIVSAINKRISDFFSHFKNRFDYYLVVNEPARPFRGELGEDKMANCYKDLGQVQFVSQVLEKSRKARGTGKLMINEVAIHEKHGFPALLKNLTDTKGMPLYDVIGIQSHMHGKIWPLSFVWEVCERYGKFNVPLHFSEVTVCSGTPNAGKGRGRISTEEGERRQAEYVVNLYKLLFSHPSVEAITWWNFSDLWAWKNSPGGLLRKNMTPKPAYTELMKLIYGEWHTRLSKRTSDTGQCRMKGFFGKYRVTAIMEGGIEKTFTFEIRKGHENVYAFTIE